MAANGKLALAFYDDKRRVNLFDASSNRSKTPFHPDGTTRASSSLAVGWVGDQSYVAFRDKEPDRDVFVGSFATGMLTGLGSETVALARMKMIDRGNSLGVLWYGEPNLAEKKAYDIFYRELNADGVPQGKPEALFDGIYPVATHNAAANRLAAFTWLQPDGKHEIHARIKQGDQPWGSARKVADAAPLTPLFDAVSAGQRSWAFWHGQYGENRELFQVKGVFTDDGNNWTPFHVKALDGWDIESASFAADGQGNVAMVAAVVAPGEHRTGKFRVKLVLSHDGGVTWSDAVNIRQDPLQIEGKSYSHARAPKAAFLAPGKLFVGWQDWRTLRSAVHYSYSEDGGKSWLVNDARLSPVAASHERFGILEHSLFAHDGKLTMVVESLPDDSMKEKNLIIRQYTSEDLLRTGQVAKAKAVAQPSEARLKERVTQYWAAMGARDFETTYAMMEPYFRNAVRFEIYKDKLGRIEYTKPTIKFTQVHGPIGLAVSNLTVEVKPIVIQRKTLKLDPQEREIPTRWLWMDGDWYVEFKSEATEVTYTPF